MRKTGSTPAQLSVCYVCHDGSGASTNIKSGATNSFSADLPSGHSVEETTTSADLTNVCTNCHVVHLDPATRDNLPGLSVNDTEVAGVGNEWCFACHNDSNDWYTSTTTTPYPDMADPSRDASGYPVYGTFPGASVYTSPTANAHLGIPASSGETTRVAGDCLYCHAAHRAPNAYDGLVATFTPSTALADDRVNGTYATSCFACHGGADSTETTAAVGAADIKQFVTAGKDRSGHRIKTSGGVLPVGAPLPCYDCHNPHGSTLGNTMLISDELGGSLEPTTATGPAAAAKVRQFCFTCHTTLDTAKGWDSAGYSTVGTATVEGIRRDGGVLKLPAMTMTGHKEADAQNCYSCHRSDYGAGGYNVHNPGSGVSPGGWACYNCHSAYSAMDNRLGTYLGDTSSFHHVLGSSSYDGDYAFADGSYPTTVNAGDTDVYCLSCHVDHDKFNADKGANLRDSATAASPNATSTDWSASTGGVCLGCHSIALTKDTTGQSSGGSSGTPAISSSAYALSAHQYSVPSTIGTSPFNADCAKCHDDGLAASALGQTSYFNDEGFSTHWSAENRILAALGVSSTPSEEDLCFACHSGSSGYDGYSVATMSAESTAVYTQITARAYTHDVDNASWKGLHRSDESQAYISANKHVECEDCHNPHAAGDTNHSVGTNLINQSNSPLAGVSGWNWAIGTASEWTTTNATWTWSTAVSSEYGSCLKCHSSKNTSLSSWNSTWTDVALEFNTKNDSYHPVFGALPAVDPTSTTGSSQLPNANRLGGQWTVGRGMTMYCSDCHGDSVADPPAMGPHGSATAHILKGPNTTWPGDYYLGGTVTGLFCLNCHPNLNSTTASNGAHIRSNHRDTTNGRCTYCHLLVPHGGKVSRLIVDADSASMPARYKGDNATIRSFRKDTADPGYAGSGKSDGNTWCYTGCAGHDTSQDYEDWGD
ncbi:MAG: cytochrome c3 family protein [Coriobacteriia bacterium]|nr:cytochrome c3 family protein [Coriobacteriia bacterium]